MLASTITCSDRTCSHVPEVLQINSQNSRQNVEGVRFEPPASKDNSEGFNSKVTLKSELMT